MSKIIVALDSQKLDAIQSCMYMYKLRFGSSFEHGFQPLITPDYYERGGLVHHMLEPYYKMKKYRQRWHQNNRTHADVVQSCINIGRYKAVHMQLDIADVEICVETFLKYATFWENDGWDNIEAIESVGSKLLYEDDQFIILYEFKIDLILNLAGMLLPVDHKTAKAHRDPNYLANQFKGYCWGLGVNNLIVNEIGFQKTKPPNEKFQRHTLSYSQSCLEEWVETSVYWVKYAIDLIKQDHYPQNFTSCDKYSGCTFKDICIADKEIRDYKLRSMFDPRTKWDVGEEHL